MPTAAVVSTLWVSEWLTENLHHLEPAKGTRLIDGMGELTPSLTVFANDVI